MLLACKGRGLPAGLLGGSFLVSKDVTRRSHHRWHVGNHLALDRDCLSRVFFRRLGKAAYLFGTLFALQGASLLYFGAYRNDLLLALGPDQELGWAHYS
jgi:hypothetical protein